MIKRMLLSLALVASIGGALAACNTPAATLSPASSTTTLPSTAPSTDLGSPATPSESMAAPSAS